MLRNYDKAVLCLQKIFDAEQINVRFDLFVHASENAKF